MKTTPVIWISRLPVPPKALPHFKWDIKILELSKDIMEKALEQAKAGRLHILNKMQEAISTHREEMSPYAPNVYNIQINPERIGDVIGPGGKMIRSIQS